MRIIHRILICLTVISALIVLLVTSTELAIYMDFQFYEEEYEKYHVLDDLDMEMKDVMSVTHEMMDYLHGKRDDLVVMTTVSGKEREFFNDREKQHMVDVKNMFLAGMKTRNAAVVILLVSLTVLIFLKAEWKILLAKWYMGITCGLLAVAIGLGYLFTRDFDKYFVKFHEIFFDNDLWLLDPDTDLMIRMLPEGFFADFTVRIGIFAATAVIGCFIISLFVWHREKKISNKQDLLIN